MKYELKLNPTEIRLILLCVEECAKHSETFKFELDNLVAEIKFQTDVE